MNVEKLNHIIGFDALYNSMCKCKNGVMWKDSVAGYRLNAIEHTLDLANDLANDSYKPRPVVRFKVMSPKPRDIASITFRDRVYQRSINDNEIYPTMTKSFIYDNWACQKGKGTDAARNRLKVFLWRYFRKYGTSGYVAQFDISGYYPNMLHNVAESVLASKLDIDINDMAKTILKDQYNTDIGYNPGSQLIQIIGISVLNKLDHFIKEDLHASLYLRYMDDFIIISHDKDYLQQCYTEIETELSKIGFKFNLKKSRVYNLSEGIEFLGFNFTLLNTGKVLMQLLSKNVKNQRKKLFRLVAKSKKGLIPKYKVTESYMAWRNHASKGDNYKLVQRMDRYYKSLWEK